MNIQEAINTIKSGKFFSGRSGGGQSWNPEDRGYLNVYDVQKEQYRMINTKTLLTINKQQVK